MSGQGFCKPAATVRCVHPVVVAWAVGGGDGGMRALGSGEGGAVTSAAMGDTAERRRGNARVAQRAAVRAVMRVQ